MKHDALMTNKKSGYIYTGYNYSNEYILCRWRRRCSVIKITRGLLAKTFLKKSGEECGWTR